MKRSTFIKAGIGAALAGARPLASFAQGAYPSRTVTLVVPTSPGGLQDALVRSLASGLAQVWKTNVIVDNKPGGSGLIGGGAVARSAPDGYTLMSSDNFSLVSNQILHKSPPFVLFKDLVPVCSVASGGNVIVVPDKSPIRTFKDLVAQAKAKPATLAYGSFGHGTIPHVDTQALAKSLGIEVVHVPYKGGAEILAALMAGDQLSFSMTGLAPALGPIRAGRIRAIAFGGKQRSPLLPDVPTISEAAVQGFYSENWFGLFAPAGVPNTVRERVSDAVAEALRSPEVIAAVAKIGLDPEFRSGSVIERELRADYARIDARLKTTGIAPG